jgi:hypothetical protein
MYGLRTILKDKTSIVKKNQAPGAPAVRAFEAAQRRAGLKPQNALSARP